MRYFSATVAACLLGSSLFAASNLPDGATKMGSASTSQEVQEHGAMLEALSASDWSAIRAEYERGQHRVFAVAGGHRARNREQQWTTFFDGRGFLTTPDSGGWEFGLELDHWGWGDVEAEACTPQAVTMDGNRLTYMWDERVAEWYVNDQRGVEHGFTIHSRPPDASGLLAIALSVRGGLVPEFSPDGRDVELLDATQSVVVHYSGLSVRDANGRSLDSRWVTLGGRLQLEVDDLQACYPLTVDPVVQQAYLKASNPGPGDYFGTAVSIFRNTVVVGAFAEASNATGVDGDQSDDSAPGAGAAYVFVRNGTTWSQQAYLKASNTGAYDGFGSAVSISGDTIVVGAVRESSAATGVDGDQSSNSAPSSGAAYVFVRNGTVWSQQAYLKASNTDAGDTFGIVSMSGDTIVVGATNEGSNATGVDGDQSNNSAPASGAAYVFVRNGTTWSQQAYLKASNTEAGDNFGIVSISDETIVATATCESSDATGVNGDQSNNNKAYSGAAYVFVRTGTTWSQQAYLKASNTDAGDLFGYDVSISKDTIVVGSDREASDATGVNGDQSDNSMSLAGAAYVFVRSGGTWSQQAYLKASNTEAGDRFGIRVAVDSNAIVVGAHWEDSNATGVDGDQSDNSALNAGAAYVFVRNGTSWSQKAYLKASNTEAVDIFGLPVAISRQTVVVGAGGEDGGVAGVNGDQSDNSVSSAGAAYVFNLSPGGFDRYGLGTSGSGGFIPVNFFDGSWAIGDDLTFSIQDGLGGALALQVIGFARASIPFGGGELLVATPWIPILLTLGGGAGVPGAGTLDLVVTIPDDPALIGLIVDAQVFVSDAAATKKLALSNGAELLIGG